MSAAEDNQWAALVELSRYVRLGSRACYQGIQGLISSLGMVLSLLVLIKI